MKNCPFCGAGIDEGYKHLKSYRCGTFHRDGKLWRSRAECYERQLSQQTELLRSVRPMVQIIADIGGTGLRAEAQALLPELEKALEEK